MIKKKGEAGYSFEVGYSLIEVMVAMGIIALLAAVAVPSYQGYVNKTDVYKAVRDLTAISLAVEGYRSDYGEYPDNLGQVGIALTDPWGNAYRYNRIDGVQGKGKARKDKNLVPINSDYDIFSLGEDGLSVSPLTAPQSHDDIVRANNGGYYGLAEDY